MSWALFAHRASPHEPTLRSPAFMLYGLDLRVDDQEFGVYCMSKVKDERLSLLLSILEDIMRRSMWVSQLPKKKKDIGSCLKV